MCPGQLVSAREHYEAFLAGHYAWMAGGAAGNLARNREFLARHRIVPRGNGLAFDLGAGCGFLSLPLAEAGFHVIAVDFCRPFLAVLREGAGSRDIGAVCADIARFALREGIPVDLVACTGDTLPHLPDAGIAEACVRRWCSWLGIGGTIVLSFRNYCRAFAGATATIPVRQEENRRFACELVYGETDVQVTDICEEFSGGQWVRHVSSYSKSRIAPPEVRSWLEGSGMRVRAVEEEDGNLITFIAEKR